jgi:hypothetical protein
MFRSKFMYVVIAAIVVFIAIQSVEPDRTNPPGNPAGSFESVAKAAPEVTAVRRLAAFMDIVLQWYWVFPQKRSSVRAIRQALGSLVCLVRQTVTRIIWIV